MSQFVAHELHVVGYMFKKLSVSCTKVVETRFAVTVFYESVLRTFPMTGKEKSAFTALPG